MSKSTLQHLLAIVLAPLTSTIGIWAANTGAGQHVPFTAGTILLPAIPIWLNALAHLYQAPPGQGQKYPQ
jgi:hypothetical protein